MCGAARKPERGSRKAVGRERGGSGGARPMAQAFKGQEMASGLYSLKQGRSLEGFEWRNDVNFFSPLVMKKI